MLPEEPFRNWGTGDSPNCREPEQVTAGGTGRPVQVDRSRCAPREMYVQGPWGLIAELLVMGKGIVQCGPSLRT